ncbi:site-specific integrase [Clostridium estertheticum]|uniref:tyrosine-type recombinase/integrase n=1 Tax=Clostridium estertheticum TaxID=238834 RepID=UPI001C0BCC4B|nr:site-specific integrase [Clostridium estertheticum]MBU3216683.1 site-specific integrase [Clostridium estertheticum]WAG54361.1 site-specific integrase [Clostridium estertheticum]
MVKMRLRSLRDGVKKTIKECHIEYLDYCISIGQAEKTIESKNRFYRFELSKIINEDESISTLTKKKIETQVIFYRQHGYKGNTYKSFVIKTRAFLTFCFDNHYLVKFDVKIPTVDSEKKIVYTEDELTLLLKKPNLDNCLIGDYKGYVICNFLLGTGCRSETLLNVKLQDIRYDEDLILFTHMKTRRQVLIPLSPTLKSVLREYVEVMNFMADDYLFAKLDGIKMCYDTLHQNISNYFKNRNVKMRGVNTFRNTFATLFIRNHGDIYRLKSILCHSKITTTEKYINLLPVDMTEDICKFNPLDVLSKKSAKARMKIR